MAKRKVRRPKAQVLNLALQDAHIRERFPGFKGRVRRGRAVWRGSLQPRPTSPIYQVQIVYKLKELPKAYVLSPALAPGAQHLYPDGSLCLYWPHEWWWRSDCIIAETIIPWTASWLYFYELWLDTGEWLGPSSHDAPKREQPNANTTEHQLSSAD